MRHLNLFEDIIAKRKKACFLCIFFLFLSVNLVCGAPISVDPLWWELKDADLHTLGYNYDRMNWKKKNELRKMRRDARGMVKKLRLHRGAFPSEQKNKADTLVIPDRAEVWIKDSDGEFSQAFFTQENGDFVITVPEKLELNGRYLVSGHVEAGEITAGFNGERAKVHLYAKSFVVHNKDDGVIGSKQSVFFYDPDKVPLEIGPIISRREFSHAGTFQTRNQEHEMEVLYGGKPLPDTEVTVMTEGGWIKILRTDSQGRFRVTPIESLDENAYAEKYLFVVVHYDSLKREIYCASLTMPVYKDRHEWRSMSGGIVLWVILGVALVVVLIMGAVYRKKRIDRAGMVIFENYRCKKD